MNMYYISNITVNKFNAELNAFEYEYAINGSVVFRVISKVEIFNGDLVKIVKITESELELEKVNESIDKTNIKVICLCYTKLPVPNLYFKPENSLTNKNVLLVKSLKVNKNFHNLFFVLSVSKNVYKVSYFDNKFKVSIDIQNLMKISEE